MRIHYLLFPLFFILSCQPQEETKPYVPKTSTDVRDVSAYKIHYPLLKKEIARKGIDVDEIKIFLRAFKKEEILEVWISGGNEKFQKLRTYPFCANSGTLGPKRKEGDYQIPEGLYHINIMNPWSQFHLSMGLNYPNKSDKIRSDYTSLGSDIYIHGGCMTIGCIPITDKNIKELYTLVNLSKKETSKTPVHIFPFRMSNWNIKRNVRKFPENQSFWQELKPFYDSFENKKLIPSFYINSSGEYIPSR